MRTKPKSSIASMKNSRSITFADSSRPPTTRWAPSSVTSSCTIKCTLGPDSSRDTLPVRLRA